MATLSVLSSVDLQCPVCHEEFTEPKFLPCAHVMCRKCVMSWLAARWQGGCPLCRAPVFPTPQPALGDLASIVDSLPTDLVTLSLIECQHALSGDQVCSVCEDATASSYCLQCAMKLCTTCGKGHKKYPSFLDHVLQDLTSLTAKSLAASRRPQCDLHPDRLAEIYCPVHQKMVCLLCSSTNHRGCLGIGSVSDVTKNVRDELTNQSRRLRHGKADVDRQILQLEAEMREVHAHFTTSEAEFRGKFERLRRTLGAREQDIASQLQKHRDDVMSKKLARKSALEQQRVSLDAHSGSVSRLLVPSPDSAVLGMLKKLKARLDDFEKQRQAPGDAGEKSVLQSPAFDTNILTLLESEISSLGRMTVKNELAPPMLTPAAVKEGKKRWKGRDKPRREQLAKILEVGDRVKRGPDWYRWDQDEGNHGTVTAIPSIVARDSGDNPEGCVDVLWDNGREDWYCMGQSDTYELDLA